MPEPSIHNPIYWSHSLNSPTGLILAGSIFDESKKEFSLSLKSKHDNALLVHEYGFTYIFIVKCSKDLLLQILWKAY